MAGRLKVLLTGGTGQLGTEMIRRGEGGGFEIWAPGRMRLNLADPLQAAGAVTELRPDVVVNAGAYTQVDRAESERELAFTINARAPAELARACARLDRPLIHISTDYVFDGLKGAPYVESDPVAPLNVYGRSKAAGESGVRAALDRHLILRTSWLYSAQGQNFLKTILRLAGERDELRVVDDQIGSPTNAADLAGAVLELLERLHGGRELPWGTYHCCAAGTISWFGFAARILESMAAFRPYRRVRLIPITTSEYPTPAARPPYSVLDCSRLATAFGLTLPPWPEGVEAAVRRLLSP